MAECHQQYGMAVDLNVNASSWVMSTLGWCHCTNNPWCWRLRLSKQSLLAQKLWSNIFTGNKNRHFYPDLLKSPYFCFSNRDDCFHRCLSFPLSLDAALRLSNTHTLFPFSATVSSFATAGAAHPFFLSTVFSRRPHRMTRHRKLSEPLHVSMDINLRLAAFTGHFELAQDVAAVSLLGRLL